MLPPRGRGAPRSDDLQDEISIYDVDDAPMMRRRNLLMAMCAVQVGLALTECAIGVFRRAAALLYMQPFFAGAGLLGYLGARDCTAW